MDLFSNGKPTNILPYDGEVIYHGKIFTAKQAQEYFDCLMKTIQWKNDEAIIFGKHIITKRKMAWYGDAGFSYTYSKISRNSLSWTNELLTLKQLAEELTGASFNSCLLNLYHDGDEGVSWHSDDEVTLGKHAAIASISFGAARKFSFKHKQSKESLSVLLEPGSLLVMQGATQVNWLHSIPKSKQVKTARINLTFRTIVGQKLD